MTFENGQTHHIRDAIPQVAGLQNPRIWDQHASAVHFENPDRGDTLLSLGIPYSARICDYGCGYGRTLQRISSYGYNDLHGIDHSSKMLRRAKDLVPTANLYGALLPENAGIVRAVDVAISLTLINSIVSDRLFRQLIESIAASMNPLGTLILDDYELADGDEYRKRYLRGVNEFGVFGIFRDDTNTVFRHRSIDMVIRTLEDLFHLRTVERQVVRSMNRRKVRLFHIVSTLR